MGQASPDAPIALTVLLNHTAPHPAPATLSLTLEKLSSGKPVLDPEKVEDCGFSGDFILSEPLDPLLYDGDDKSWVGLKNKCCSWSQIWSHFTFTAVLRGQDNWPGFTNEKRKDHMS